MSERVPIHTWVYTVDGQPESTIESGSTDPDEIRGLILTQYRGHVTDLTLRRLT